MNADAHLKRAAAQRAIRRAARIAQVSLAVHSQSESGESSRVTGCGACAEACRYVHTLPWGPQACRKSRETPARQALRRGRPVPFLCHMGFACVAAPVYPATDETLVMTLGPFCPSEAPDSLERDAADGLNRLERVKHDQLPFALTDVPRVPAEVPPDVAHWLGETLAEQFAAPTRALPAHAALEAVPEMNRTKRRRPDKIVRDAFGARAILAAMSSSSSASLRAAVMAQLTASRPLRPDVLRARAMATAAAAIDAAEREGTVPELARSRLEALPAGLGRVERADSACRAVLHVLAPARRNLLQRASRQADEFAALDRYVTERIAQPVTLSAAAVHLHLTPSTLTRRIERRFGVTFTGYVARKRVERAKALLERTQLSVDTIARRVGFSDGAHLRKQLKRFEGVTPSDVRGPKRAAG